MPPSRPAFGPELRRKLLHLAALVLPAAVLRWGDPFIYGILIPGALLALAADLLRVRAGWLHRLIGTVFGPLMRSRERPPLGAPPCVNGATWMALSASAAFLLFTRPIAALAFSVLVLGDAAAALVGRTVGTIRLGSSEKTLEGSLGFVIAGLVPVVVAAELGAVSYWAGAAAVLAAAGAEATTTRLNDNLLIPLVAGLVLTVLG